jgi:hypothetical protein
MAFVSRGKPRDLKKAVRCTGAIFHGFKTKDLSAISGVSSGDITALGQVDPTTLSAGEIAVYGATSPKGARFKKTLQRYAQAGVQGSVTTYGNGNTASAIATAGGAGWNLISGVRLTNLRSTLKSRSVGIPLSNGLIYVQPVPIQDLGYAETLGWILPESFSSAERAKAVRGVNNMKPAKVVRVDQTTGQTITAPCAFNKLADAADAGWFDAEPEKQASNAG